MKLGGRAEARVMKLEVELLRHHQFEWRTPSGDFIEAVGGDCRYVSLADDRLLCLVILVSCRARVDMSRRICCGSSCVYSEDLTLRAWPHSCGVEWMFLVEVHSRRNMDDSEKHWQVPKLISL